MWEDVWETKYTGNIWLVQFIPAILMCSLHKIFSIITQLIQLTIYFLHSHNNNDNNNSNNNLTLTDYTDLFYYYYYSKKQYVQSLI